MSLEQHTFVFDNNDINSGREKLKALRKEQRGVVNAMTKLEERGGDLDEDTVYQKLKSQESGERFS